MKFDPSQLTEEQKQTLLRDDNNNDIPDVFEQGQLLEEVGINTGLPMDYKSALWRRKGMKFLGRFVRVSELKKQFEQGNKLSSGYRNQIELRKWLPLFFAFDFILIALLLYIFVFNK